MSWLFPSRTDPVPPRHAGIRLAPKAEAPDPTTRGESALNRLPLTDLASDAPLGVGAAVCAVGAPTGKSGRPFEQSRPTFGLGGASERERQDLHPSMRTCAVKPVGLAAGLRLCLESWRGSSDRRLLCVPAGASPALGRGVAATRRASGACSTPNRACRSSRSSAASKGSQEAGRVALNSRAAHLPLSGSLTSREFVNPSPPATTLKDVPTAAGESTAVNSRIYAVKPVGLTAGVQRSVDTHRGSESLLGVHNTILSGSERSSDPTRRSIDLRVPTS